MEPRRKKRCKFFVEFNSAPIAIVFIAIAEKVPFNMAV